MGKAGNGIGRMLLGLAAGLIAFGVAMYWLRFDLLVALGIGVGAALLVWLLIGLVWGVGEPVFVTPAPRVRKIVVDRSVLEAEPEAVPVVPEPAPVARVTAAPVRALAEPVRPPAAPDAGPEVLEEPDFEFDPDPPVIRPKRTVRLEAPVVVTDVANTAVVPKPRASARPRAPAKARASAKPKTTVATDREVPPMVAARPKAKGKPRLEASPVPQKTASAKPATKPRVAKSKAGGPVRLEAPRNGKPDDLKVIAGIGPALEKLLQGLGFYHFDQIANWSDADVAMVDAQMKTFKGRATRDKWVVQARTLAAGGTVAEAEAAAKA